MVKTTPTKKDITSNREKQDNRKEMILQQTEETTKVLN